MKLRKLELKDAPLMLEWMHDRSVTKHLQTDFSLKTIDDCRMFIKSAEDTEKNIHMAIVDQEDVYMGTVSLKHICNGTAEFAITIRTIAMGKGFSKFAMSEIIRIGLYDLKLKCIYWCVSPDNIRAVRFYDKNQYQRANVEDFKPFLDGYSIDQIYSYTWYQIINN